MLVLAIETSCDETAASVVLDGTRILSDVVVSQMEIHREFGGVVPELASRKHIEAISLVVEEALVRANVTPQRIEAIGVTRGPGLIGCLLVGIATAKGMALALDIPMCGVHHLHAHLFAVLLDRPDVVFPFVGLVVSGGHTSLFHVKSPLDIQLVGKTRDDAAGEAFDKVAKLLGLGYPGGPIIEEVAQGVDPGSVRFPRALMEKNNLDFSFSGLKTAVLKRVEGLFEVKQRNDRSGSFHPLVPPVRLQEARNEIREVAAAFQEAVVETLVVKGLRCAEKYASEKLVVCGGVAANRTLRRRMTEEAARLGIEPVFPPIRLCTDNAAMVAARADALLAAGKTDDLGFGALSRW
ncbi:MAG: tRNA (adenosine(37)-N6)-threonylcarbamoyltransferase complex transferase subunit TsaD [Desulfomonile tiedjei]|nr:tRNA (adenosine(37)-N6)-threonylcarbamoyltransferase complex transferase subunit TsaD [Desulfomonile tiedjei]